METKPSPFLMKLTWKNKALWLQVSGFLALNPELDISMQSQELHGCTGFLTEGMTPRKPTRGESEQNTYSQQAGSPQRKRRGRGWMKDTRLVQWDEGAPPPKKDMSTWNLWLWPYLEKTFFIDGFKLRILKWDHPGGGWALHHMAGDSGREGQKTERRRPETRVMHLQAKKHQGLGRPPRVRREAPDRSFLRAMKGTNPVHTLVIDFWPPEPYKRMDFHCLKPLGLC